MKYRLPTLFTRRCYRIAPLDRILAGGRRGRQEKSPAGGEGGQSGKAELGAWRGRCVTAGYSGLWDLVQRWLGAPRAGSPGPDKDKRPPVRVIGGPRSGDANDDHRWGRWAGSVLVAAARGFTASRLATIGFAARLTAVVPAAAALQPAAQFLERSATRAAAARLAARLTARRFATGRLAARRFAARRLTAGGLAAGRLTAARLTARMAAMATTDQVIEQLECLGTARAGNQRDAKHQGGEQDSTFHGDCSFKRVRESTDLAARGRETNSNHSSDRANSCCGIVDAQRLS